MTIKVIGAGFGRTGTLSMKFALEMLGFEKCYHMMEVGQNPGHMNYWLDLAAGKEVDWAALFAGYQASVDWPSANFWREQLLQYPQATVLLTRRDPDRWYESVINTIWKTSSGNKSNPDKKAQASSRFAFEVIWDRVFDGRLEDKEHVIACYEAHNQAVIDEVPPKQLLVYEPGQGWNPLCDFLGIAIPDKPYPHVNSTAEFTQRWQKIAAEAEARR